MTASVLVVASGSEDSRGMLVRRLGNMQERYTKENVAAMQNHSINSFAADQQQYQYKHQQRQFLAGSFNRPACSN
jgi:hypothetical protein